MTTTATLSDTELLRRVRVELDWNPRVQGKDIAATVKNGVVTLTGFVDSYAKKVAAVDAIHHVTGVLDVADDVQVKFPGQGKTDQEIAQAVRAALVWDVFVPDERIQSTVSNGWVTLAGEVDRLQQREDATRSVEHLSGVRGITNQIVVKGPRVDAVKLRTSIEDALKRRAEREAKRISISTDDGVVTLRGKVDSWAERASVAQLAAFAPGVKSVVNEITVDPYA